MWVWVYWCFDVCEFGCGLGRCGFQLDSCGVVDLCSACCVVLGVTSFGVVVLIWLFSDLLVVLLLCGFAGCLVVRISFFCVVWFASFPVFGFGAFEVCLGFDVVCVLWFTWYFGLVGVVWWKIGFRCGWWGGFGLTCGWCGGGWLGFGLLVAVWVVGVWFWV